MVERGRIWKAAKWFESACFPDGVKLATEAADTIEVLSAKMADMERSAEDCGGGWIECESGKLPDKEVICCDVCGEIIIGYIHETYESEQTGFSAENSHEYMYNCVKWMEKPKP